MILSKTHKFIYIANPRTGSTSISSLLKQYDDLRILPNFTNFLKIHNIHNPNHLLQNEAKSFLSESNEILDTSDFYEFMFVRNPYTRLISLYMLTIHKSKHPYTIQNDIHETSIKQNKAHNFDLFLNKCEDVLNGVKLDDLTKFNQLDYFKNPFTQNMHVYKFEELETSWTKIQNDIGLNLGTLPKLQSSPINNNPDILNYKQKDRIYNLFKEEFEKFRYSK